MVARCFPIPLFVLSLVKSINVINSIQQNMPLETNVVDKYVYIYIHLHKSGKVVVFFSMENIFFVDRQIRMNKKELRQFFN